MLKSLSSSLLIAQAAGHGWLSQPLSKNELQWQLKNNHGNWPQGLPEDFRYEPFSCANGNNAGGHLGTPAASCGAKTDVHARGLDAWQQWYDAAGIAVPVITPGSDMKVRVELSTDHGGQHWFMIACGNEISESINWTYLERSASDRSNGFLPSNPTMFGWPVQSLSFSETYYHVPASFSCPGGVGVGRWLWKTANTCNDVNNVGRPTERFQASEAAAVGLDRAACASPPETFISCFDFKVSGTSQPTPVPVPTPPAPTPTQAPPTPAPTGPGLCCYGGCSGGNCQGGWCGESRGNCEGNCNGDFCPAGAALASFQHRLRSNRVRKADLQPEA